MKVDIISSIYGNKKVVDPCIESWFPLPDGWNIHLYNNLKSSEDGTRDMLLEKNKHYNFNIIDESINIRHAEALNKLIKITTSDWILMLDSDAYLLDKRFYIWADQVMEDNKIMFWGTSRLYLPHLTVGWNPPLPTYLMPRADSWIMFINRTFMNKYNLKPDPIRIEGNVKFGKIWNKDLSEGIDRDHSNTVRIAGDVGWQFHSVATQLNLFKKIPDNILKYWKHVGHASCDWNKKLQ